MKKKILELAIQSKKDRFWYTKARKNLKFLAKQYNIPYKTIAGITAITSQNIRLEHNMKIVLDWIKNGANIEACEKIKHYSIVKNNAKMFLQTGQINGPKISQFYEALIGNNDAIVLDTHMASAFNVKNKWSKTKMNLAKKDIQKISKHLNWKPCQVQAAIWCSIYKQKSNKTQAANYSF